jgi:UDP-N-acetylglucosamine 2-epimerase (non-hydrolysing)/GDP/UDP-N,N'-diacetylbacillosamine 2-epimerase (hydrolysing)
VTRTICVVTGTRAEYGLLKSPMQSIEDSGNLELKVVATGMHLSPQCGRTVTDIQADDFDIDRTVDMLIDGDSGLAMAKSTGIGTMGLAEAFRSLEPDIVLVLGDRDEPLAAGIAAAHMNIPVAHIHGGDVMVGATIDDSIRHALTKFAHLHFPASERSARRVSQLGEEEWRIETVGAPGLDAIRSGSYVPGPEMRDSLDIASDQDLILCVQHPVTTEPGAAPEQMSATLDAIAEFDAAVVLVYPNADAGRDGMVDVIESHSGTDGFRMVKSLPRLEYLGVMDAADVMVGNSSSGVIESTALDLPVVDIGPREKRRERAENVVSVPHDRDAIARAVDEVLTDPAPQRRAASAESPYDYGGSGDEIAAVLEEVSLGERLLRKELTF